MSRWRNTTAPVALSFPRVSGDEPAFTAGSKIHIPFSPRERG